jgi:CRP-like cAMP-binding protein
VKEDNMIRIDSPLFTNLTDEEVLSCLRCSGARKRTYEKNEIIFDHDTKQDKLYILLDGMVGLCMDSLSGDKSILTVLDKKGEIFGEVYMFIENNQYDYYALVLKKSVVLEIPKVFFYQKCEKCCSYHSKLISNMLGILASKAYYLTKKNQLLSSTSLRQKLTKYILMNMDRQGFVKLNMSREDLANYLNVKRPSLSRELINMHRDNLIEVSGRTIKVVDIEKLADNL